MTSTTPLTDLVAELQEVVFEHRWHDLKDELPDPEDQSPIRIGFVGPFNAGKSTLIAALSGDLSIKRDAKPETVFASSHLWRDCVLVDMPGWFSGFADHDETAYTELRRHVDIIVFTMTVELGEENLIAAARRVFADLGFGSRGLIVVNKKNTEDNDPDVIRDEVDGRLGQVAGVPVVLTDAQDFLDTISGEEDYDEESAETLRSGSGIHDLEEALHLLVETWQSSGRRHAQAKQAGRVAEECMTRLKPDQDEQAERAVITQLGEAVVSARAQLDAVLSSRLDELESAVSRIAEVEEARIGPSGMRISALRGHRPPKDQ